MTLLLSSDVVPPSVKVHVENFKQIHSEYQKIRDFIRECISPGYCFDKSEKQFKGLYIDSFFVGVWTVLQSMNETINRIKENILNTSDGVSWLHITNECEYLPCVLTSFSASIEMIKSGKYNGCKIFDLCDSFMNSGIPAVEHVFLQIQKFCLKKLYLQTKLWLMQAELHDPFNEYFIAKSPSLSQDNLINTSAISSATFINTGIYSDSCASVITRASSSISSNSCDSHKHEINGDNLPSLIPFSIAVKILFIGEALIMCHCNRGNQSKNNLLEDCGISEENVIAQFNKMENYQQFVLRDYNYLVNDLWIKINMRIREISDQIGNVSSELILMSDIYLLGRGDLFQEFLVKASCLLTADATTVSSRHLNTALKDAFYNVYLTDISDLVDNFYFGLPNRKSLKPGIKTMTVLSLEYNVKWPLYYLFTREVMNYYKKIFRFLLALKKAQIVLTSVWKHINLINEYSLRTEFIETQMHLLSFVVNLQNYCLTYVITYEMNILLVAVKASKMFTDLQKIFSSFLCNVSNRLFVTNLFHSSDRSVDSRTIEVMEEINRKVYNCFLKIFSLCDLFSELLNEDMEQNSRERLCSIKTELYKVLKIFFSLIKKIDQNCWYDDDGSAGHLFNLIMCLDYNRFYQKKFQINFDD